VLPAPEMQIARFVCSNGSAVSFQNLDATDEYGIPAFSEGEPNQLDDYNQTFYKLKGGFRINGNCWVNVWPAKAIQYLELLIHEDYNDEP
jgi:hypothetical protein